MEEVAIAGLDPDQPPWFLVQVASVGVSALLQ